MEIKKGKLEGKKRRKKIRIRIRITGDKVSSKIDEKEEKFNLCQTQAIRRYSRKVWKDE